MGNPAQIPEPSQFAMLTLVDAKLNFFMISGADGPISGFSCLGKTTEISKETEPGASLSRSGGLGTSKSNIPDANK